MGLFESFFFFVFFPEDVLSLFSQVLKLVDEDWLLDLLEFVNASSCLCTAPGRRRRRHGEREGERGRCTYLVVARKS